MHLKIIMDNWSLQDLGIMLCFESLNHNPSRFLEIQELVTIPLYNSIHLSSEQNVEFGINVLVNLLNDIVLRDKIVVPNEYSIAWKELNPNPFSILLENKIIEVSDEAIPSYMPHKPALHQIPEISIERIKGIIETDPILNTLRFNNSQEPDEAYKKIKDGIVKYLNASSRLDVPYSPHPIRQQVISKLLLNEPKDGVIGFKRWVKKQRHEVINKIDKNIDMNIGKLIIDPIFVEIISSSSSVKEIFENAIKLRKKFTRVRKFLRRYQDALNEGNIKKLKKISNTFESLENKLLNKESEDAKGKLNLSFGFGLIEIGSDISLGLVKSKLSIKSSFQKIILTNNSVEPMLKLFQILSVDDQDVINRILKTYEIH